MTGIYRAGGHAQRARLVAVGAGGQGPGLQRAKLGQAHALLFRQQPRRRVQHTCVAWGVSSSGRHGAMFCSGYMLKHYTVRKPPHPLLHFTAKSARGLPRPKRVRSRAGRRSVGHVRCRAAGTGAPEANRAVPPTPSSSSGCCAPAASAIAKSTSLQPAGVALEGQAKSWQASAAVSVRSPATRQRRPQPCGDARLGAHARERAARLRLCTLLVQGPIGTMQEGLRDSMPTCHAR